MKSELTALLAAGLLSACVSLAPDYARPALPIPAGLNGAPTAPTALALPAWQDMVSDPRLSRLITLALASNRDLRIAALNADKARAAWRITDAGRLPSVEASTGSSATRSQSAISRQTTAALGFSSFELDLFGRLRNLSEAALASFHATEADQQSARLSLIAEVADDWLSLAADQELLKLANQTAASRQKTVELTARQRALGGASALALAQQQASLETARDDVASYTALVAQDLNALTLAVGTPVPAELLPGGADTMDSPVARLLDLPAGLSSRLLLERPDIVSAEYTLKASHADIGAARAAFFPSISLSASAGSASTSLDGLFGNGSGVWSFAPRITLPIFNAGSLKASLDGAKIAKDIQVASYERAIQTAFREVADALAIRQVLAERLAAQQGQVSAWQRSVELTRARYRSGADSYLAVLDAERSLYAARKSLVSLKKTEQGNRITLFKVLGGH